MAAGRARLDVVQALVDHFCGTIPSHEIWFELLVGCSAVCVARKAPDVGVPPSAFPAMTPAAVVVKLTGPVIALVMLGLGMELSVSNFHELFARPRAVVVGLASQALLLPTIGFLLAAALSLPPVIAVGVMIIAACPGGPVSNLLTYLAQGDVALSLSLTSLSSVLALLTIPFVVNLAISTFTGQPTAALPVASTVSRVFVIVIPPVLVGMTLRHFFPRLVIRLRKATNVVATLLLVVLIVVTVGQHFRTLRLFLGPAGLATVSLNLTTMLLAWIVAVATKLTPAQRVTICFEVGIQNVPIALYLAINLLHNPPYAVPVLCYGVFSIISGPALLLLLRWRAGGRRAACSPSSPNT